MKKILTVIALILAIACSGGNMVYAQSKGKKGHRTHQTHRGQASPIGHIYEFSQDGVTISLNFTSPETVNIALSQGEKTSSLDLKWTQEKDEIQFPGYDPMKISRNGRTLTENTGRVYKRVK